MASKKSTGNLKLAGIFILLVFVLIAISLVLKFVFVLKESKFDASHRFVVVFIGNSKTTVASFTPSNNAIAVLKVNRKLNENNLSSDLEVPIDGIVRVGEQEVSGKNVSSVLFKSAFYLGNPYKNMTPVDVFRLFLFSKGVNSSSIYERELSNGLTQTQQSTILSLSFTDPAIYQENKSIQIINASNTYGLGTKLAAFITTIGGNVILVSTAQNPSDKSKITYSDNKSYTADKLADFLGFSLEKSDTRGVADVIIIIGTDKINKINY